MVQLDDVFTNSASGENEVANLDVAAEIRKMQQIQLDQIFDIQNELSHLKALKDVPQDLAQLLRRAASSVNKAKMACMENEQQEIRQNIHKDAQQVVAN